MSSELIIVGTELLSGHKRDAHVAYLGSELQGLGEEPRFATLVADDAASLRLILQQALERSERVFVCGGLGPTLDDISRDIAAEIAEAPLQESPQLVEHLKALFASRGRSMPLNNLRQAQVPEGATVLENPQGSAPGLRIPCRGRFQGRSLFLLPGPPHELAAVFEGALKPWLQAELKAPPRRVRSLLCWGLAESAVDELIKDLVAPGDTRTLAMLANGTIVEVRLSGNSEAELAPLERSVLERLGDHVFSSEGKALEQVVVELLMKEGKTVAVAESCTGGRVSSKLTSVPGSSQVFKMGLVCYSNESKEQLLDVPPFVLKRVGAVSSDVALAMAVGLARKSGCDFAISVTGIAGPDGGTSEKPVGLVHFALAGPNGVVHQEFRFGNSSRNQIQERAAQAALYLLYASLAGLKLPESGSDRASTARRS